MGECKTIALLEQMSTDIGRNEDRMYDYFRMQNGRVNNVIDINHRLQEQVTQLQNQIDKLEAQQSVPIRIVTNTDGPTPDIGTVRITGDLVVEGEIYKVEAQPRYSTITGGMCSTIHDGSTSCGICGFNFH